MSAIDQVFQRLRADHKKAFIPFVTAGDPDLEFTRDVVLELDRRGAAICEIGIPYSDPIADGPVIQASYTRALAHKIRLPEILTTIDQLHGQCQAALVTMISYAIILRHGLEPFVSRAAASGVGGLIVPDLLVEESDELAAVCRAHDVSLIQLVTPTTPRERAVRIAETSTGFLYYVSVAGITGERRQLPADLVDNVSWLRSRASLPVCIGFGISRPEHVAMLAEVADGVIVGSALVRHFESYDATRRQQTLDTVGNLASQLMAAL